MNTFHKILTGIGVILTTLAGSYFYHKTAFENLTNALVDHCQKEIGVGNYKVIYRTASTTGDFFCNDKIENIP